MEGIKGIWETGTTKEAIESTMVTKYKKKMLEADQQLSMAGN
jgi:hypothetical protein